MISDRFKNDGKVTISVSDSQKEEINTFLSLLRTGALVMERVNCLCGVNDFHLLAEKDRYGIPLNTVMCKACGQVMSNPRLDQKSTEYFYQHLYRKIYVGKKRADEAFFNKQVRHGYRILEQLRPQLANTHVSVLEVGCGAGGILWPFQESGFDCKGIDLGDEYLTFGRQQSLNLSCQSSQVLAAGSDKKYDVVILSHVLEHFLDMESEISTICQLMADDALLYVEVPGLFNLQHSYHCDFQLYLQNAHNYHFNLAMLERVMAKFGLTLLHGDESVKAVFVKRSDTQVSFTNQYPGVLDYLSSLEAQREAFARTLRRSKQQEKAQRYAWLNQLLAGREAGSVSLYGTGAHTEMLLQHIDEPEVVHSIITPSEAEAGNTFQDKPVELLQAPYPKTIVVSSNTFQESIWRRIKHLEKEGVELITLYR